MLVDADGPLVPVAVHEHGHSVVVRHSVPHGREREMHERLHAQLRLQLELDMVHICR